MSKAKKVTRKRSRSKADRRHKRGGSRRLHTGEERKEAIEDLVKGKKNKEVAEKFGVSTECVRLWWLQAQREGIVPKVSPSLLRAENPVAEQERLPEESDREEVFPQNSTAPKDPAYGLSAGEVEAILELKQEHPTMGPAQIRAQLKRFKGWRVSVKAISRTLTKNGYELEHRGNQPKGFEPQRFEAPHRNSLWQLDFMEVRLAKVKLFILVILDDFSRFLVAARLLPAPTSEAVVETLKESIRLHGKPEGVYTDRGGAFLAWRNETGFKRYCEQEVIDHHVGRSYHPQGRGKVEAVIRTIRQELWQVHHFSDEHECRKALACFVAGYNFRRAHMGIDGLTPADRYFGRWPEVLDRINAVSRKRNDAHLFSNPSALTEDLGYPEAPVEALRFLIHEGKLEIRLFGHTVVLGPLEK